MVLTEYALVRRAADVPPSEREASLAQVCVSDGAFEELKKLVFVKDADAVLTLTHLRGKEVLRVKNYVGLLQTADGTQWEILPKIAQGTDVVVARKCLLKMLQNVQDGPFRHLTQAQMQAAHLPLWEIFVGAFATEMEQLTRQGIQKCYQLTEDTQPFLRGKWQPHRQRPLHQETFSVVYDEFSANVLPNRLLKSCVLYLSRQSQDFSNQTRLRRLRFAWDEVPPSTNPKQDFERLTASDRRFDRYQKALQWAKVLLFGQGWTGQGATPQWSLLWPTERLFEQYVARSFRRYWEDYDVVYQDSSTFLIADHQGQKRFHLRPDLVLRKRTSSPTFLLGAGEGSLEVQTPTWVLDIKWKWLTPTLPHYGIDQSDLYQLYAYGRKYEADALYLLYPAHEAFQAALPPFYYDEHLSVTVVPFDLTAPLDQTMQQLREVFEG